MDDKELEERIYKIEKTLKDYAHKLCYGNGVNPEDLYQDTFVKLWSNRHMYKYDDSFRAWGKRIMHNIFIDTVKIENRFTSITPSNEYTDVEWYQENMIKRSTDNYAPSFIDVADMIDSLDLLSDKDKRIIQMFLIEGYNQAEIAVFFNTNPNNIKQRVFNAVRLVREDLKEKFDIDETYFSKIGLLDIQKKYRKRSTQVESNYRKKFNR